MSPSSTHKIVYAVIRRSGRKHWLRIGIAFVNRDGSLNVRLDAVPLTGQASHPATTRPSSDR